MADIKQFMKDGNNIPLPKGIGKQMGINVDINALQDMGCIHCGNLEFQSIVRVKKLPATASPNGQAGSVNLNMLKCTECGWLFNAQEWEKAQEQVKEKTVNINETIPLKDTVKTDIKKEVEDNRILCRKCGTFFDKGTEHVCK